MTDQNKKPTVEWDPRNPRILRFPDGSTAEGPNVTATADEVQGTLNCVVSYKASGGMALEFTQAWAKSLAGNADIEAFFAKLPGMMGEPDPVIAEGPLDAMDLTARGIPVVGHSLKERECDHNWVEWRGHNSSMLDHRCTKCGKLKE